MQNNIRAKVIITFILVLLAACSGTVADNTPTPMIDDPTSTPLPVAPAWTEPGALITTENVAQIQLLGRLDPPGELSTLFAHAFSPDGTQLAALSNTDILVWDLITGQRLFTIDRRGTSYLYYSSDKTELYAIDPQGVVYVLDANNGTIKSDFLGHPDFSGAIDFKEDLLAMGGFDGTTKVWDTFERRSLVTFNAHERTVDLLRFSPDAEVLVTSGDLGTVKLWNWREREVLHTLDNGNSNTVDMAFSNDGQQLAVAANNFISLWTVATGEFLYTLQIGSGGASDILQYSPEGKYLINGGDIDDMNVWDAQAGEFLALLPDMGGRPISAAFSADGSMLLASELDGPVTLWNMASITSETVARADLQPGTERVLEVDWSPDGFVMLFFDALGPVYVWGIPQ